jgi:DNA-binding beta-propeller fold protein YncE
VVDTATDTITQTIALDGHEQAAQIARYSPDGRHLVVTSMDAALATILDSRLGTQRLLRLGQGPMNMAFHPDGRTVLIANQNEGTLALCDLERAEVLRTVQAAEGVEALSFF